ncbi:MAG TPA: CHAT domain-containing protein, partial [Polyangia bacterium]|nr:CHAT domain-containing protein [Polyangia bacterium]
MPYDAAATAATARAIVAVLARSNQARTLTGRNLDDLRHHGETLWRTLIPPEIQRQLERGDTLTLELDEALVAVPWELMFDGAQFLCRRLSIGRHVATRQPRRGDERRTVGTPARVLVMAADPRGDLPEVRAEGDAILAELERHPTVHARLSNAPDRAFALRYFKDYDVVHFAGHADFVAAQPGASGWLLADGKLTADELAKLGGGRPMPMIVFGNACQSGATEAWNSDGDGDNARVFGLANALLTAGVRHYIGTQWEVVDGQSAQFAAALYRELADGKTIGAAVRHARGAVVAQAGEAALAWASYVLYGDPEARPLQRPDARIKLSIPSAARIAARASAPWKRPALSGARNLPLPKAMAPVASGNVTNGAAPAGRASWVYAAVAGVALGLFGVAVVWWRVTKKPPMVDHPTSRGVAVLALSASASAEDQQQARQLEWCLPGELEHDRVPVVPPANLDTLQAQTNGALDRLSARRIGLAVGARWVVYGNVAGGTANVFVSAVIDDRTVHADSFAVSGDGKSQCTRFAAEAAAALAKEPPP